MGRPAGMIAGAVLLLVLLHGSPVFSRHSMPAKCSACRCVAEVLEEKLEKEVPRNHLDMRHRLDKHGKRYGKLIDYKMSELRVIHLLEDLCDGMKDYQLVPEDKEAMLEAFWVKSDNAPTDRKNEGNVMERAHLIKEQRKELQNFCADLLERHEDALSNALRNGDVGTETVSDFLCYTTAKHCDEAIGDGGVSSGVFEEANAGEPVEQQQEGQQQQGEASAGGRAQVLKEEL